MKEDDYQMTEEDGQKASSYKILGVTGNRPHKIPPLATPLVKERIFKAVSGFKASGGEVLIQGGALGVDQWAAAAALKIGLQAWTYVPFPQQAEGWSENDRLRYEDILRKSFKVKVFGEEKKNNFYFVRNAAIVKDSDIMLSLTSSSEGGGAWTAKEALRVGRPLIEVKILEDGLEEEFHPGLTAKR